MGIRPHALYSILLEDLSEAVPSSTLENIERKVKFWPGMTFKDCAAGSIAGSLVKKWQGNLSGETKAKALEKFLLVNNQCKNWDIDVNCLQTWDQQMLDEFKNLVHKFWNRGGFPLTDHPYDLLAKAKVGPGAAVGARGGDFYTKLFDSKLTCTSSYLYFWYKRYINSFPEWKNAEAIRISAHGNYDVVDGNRLDFVPKNDDIARSICVEPSLNMFYQLGLNTILLERLKEFSGIDLEYQQFKNRQLAKQGSWNGSFSTIDLSSASDSISLKMLQQFLPPDFFRLLERLRSRVSKLPNGSECTLHMISTMGNGYTFSLQTILFTCVVIACFKLHGLAPIRPENNSEGNFGVNGDDIVVPTEISRSVLRLLQLLGFTPNSEKTFVEGPFRESCGGDYFNGRNLRGVYIDTLNQPSDYYSVINQLNLFSTRTGIILPKLVQRLLKEVRYNPVPIWDDDSAGVKVPWSVARRYTRVDKDTGSILYFRYEPIPPPRVRILDSTLSTPRGFKPRGYNPSGLFLSILQGSVNSMSIPLRPKEVRYRARPRIACNWDTPLLSDIRTVQLFAGWFVFGRWESAAYLNLFK